MQIKAITRYQQNFGFSLVELMITIVILGVVTAIAVPSYTGMVANNRVVEASNRLMSNIQQARSEAIKRNSPVSLGTYTSQYWHKGWKMYAGDLTGSDTVGAGDVLIRLVPASDDSVTMYANTHAGTWLSFFANGMMNEASNAIFYICNNGDASRGRMITVDRGGRARIDDIPSNDDCKP